MVSRSARRLSPGSCFSMRTNCRTASRLNSQIAPATRHPTSPDQLSHPVGLLKQKGRACSCAGAPNATRFQQSHGDASRSEGVSDHRACQAASNDRDVSFQASRTRRIARLRARRGHSQPERVFLAAAQAHRFSSSLWPHVCFDHRSSWRSDQPHMPQPCRTGPTRHPFRRSHKSTATSRSDVLVVGGGITGLTTAYLLLDSGTSVAVLERARCGQIDTGHTSAHLTMVTDTRLSELVRRFGRDHAQAVWDSGLAAIAQIETIVHDRAIDCAFERVDGFLHAPNGATRRGRPGVRRGGHARERPGVRCDLRRSTCRLPAAPGVRFDDQARFHPRKYLAGLAGAIRDEGGLIFEHSDADGILRRPASGEGQRTLGARAATSCWPLTIRSSARSNLARAAAFQTKLALYTSTSLPDALQRASFPTRSSGTPRTHITTCESNRTTTATW